MKKLLTILLTLLMVLVMIPATVFADDSSVTINATNNGGEPGTDTDGTHFNVIFDISDENGWNISTSTFEISSKGNERITKIDFIVGLCTGSSSVGTGDLSASPSGTFSTEEGIKVDGTVTLTFDNPVSSVQIKLAEMEDLLQFKSAKIYYREAASFTVTYNANDATSGTAPTDQTKIEGESLTLATNTGNLEKANYTFTGWNTQADGKGTHYDVGATYTTDDDLDVYAEWNKTIANILPNSFPTSDANAWANNNNKKSYINNDYLLFGEDSIATNAVVTDSSGNYVANTLNGGTATFVINNNALTSIEVAGSSKDGVNGTYTIAPVANRIIVDLNGGTIDPANVPEGWNELISGSNKFYKDFDNSVWIDESITEWCTEDTANHLIVDDNKVFYTFSFSYYYTSGNQVIVKAVYGDAIPVTVKIDNTHSGATLTNYRTKIRKGTRLQLGNKFYDEAGYGWNFTGCFAQVTPNANKCISYFTVNDVRYENNSTLDTSDYFAPEAIKDKDSYEIVIHMADDYGVSVNNVTINSLNYGDVLKGDYYYDGKVSFDNSKKELTIVGFEGDTPFIGVDTISSDIDLTIKTTNNIKINGIEATGDLDIQAKNNGTFNVLSKGITAKELTISSGIINIESDRTAITVEDLVIATENSPEVSIHTKNRLAINASNSININGANILGAYEYVPGTTKQVYQTSDNTIDISFTNDAIDYYLVVGNTKITSENKDSLSFGSYNPNTHTLVLNDNAYIEGTGYGIFSKDDLIINLLGSASIKSNCAIYSTGDNYGIYCEGDLTINGVAGKALTVDNNYSSGISYYTNVGIYSDRVITINCNVNAYTGDFKYTDDDIFKIGAGIWGLRGVTIEGSSDNKLTINVGSFLIPCGEYNSYGILSGNGNPGFDDNREINIKYATVNVSMQSHNSWGGDYANYGIYAYGPLNIENSTISPELRFAYDEMIYINSNSSMNIKDSVVNINYPSYEYSDNTAINGINSEDTLTIDNSEITIVKSNSKVKKISSIRAAETLTIKGEDTALNIGTTKTVDGEIIGISAKKKLDIQAGNITVTAEGSTNSSYAIFAGNSSFDGNHSIKNCTLNLNAGVESGDSIALKSKNGNMTIDGANITAVAGKYAIDASKVLTIDQTDSDNKTIINASVAENEKAIHSKEVLVLNNEPYIKGANNEYDPTLTDSFVQDGSDPVNIYYREEVTVSGISMVYPKDKTSYTYGDTVSYKGTPVSTKSDETTVSELTDDDYTYSYLKKNDGVYENFTGVPSEVGSYKLVVATTRTNDTYIGKQEIEFTIAKKDVEATFNCYSFEYDSTSKTPVLIIKGLVNNDVYDFGNSNPTYSYKKDGGSISVPSDIGEYEITASLNKDIVVIKHEGTTVTDNYNIAGLTTSYC